MKSFQSHEPSKKTDLVETEASKQSRVSRSKSNIDFDCQLKDQNSIQSKTKDSKPRVKFPKRKLLRTGFEANSRGNKVKEDVDNSETKQASKYPYKSEPRAKLVSIPTRFTTVFSEESGQSKKKAFCSSSSRFSTSSESSSGPGPGSYSLYSSTLYRDNKESHSRRGYGNMASISERKTGHIRFLNTGPGPASYSQISENSFDSMRDRSTEKAPSALTRVRRRLKEQITPFRIRLPEKEDFGHLGPGSYQPQKPLPAVPNYSQVSFKSVEQRDKTQNMEGPPVGLYNLSRELIKPKPYLEPSSTAAFKPPFEKDFIMAHNLEGLKEHILGEGESQLDAKKTKIHGVIKDPVPGPAYYNGAEAHKKLTRAREASLLTYHGLGLVQQKRFLRLSAKNKNYPGPGQYKAKSYFDGDKYKVYHSVFMSETGRQEEISKEPIDSRPNYDSKDPTNKESFHLNNKNIWV